MQAYRSVLRAFEGEDRSNPLRWVLRAFEGGSQMSGGSQMMSRLLVMISSWCHETSTTRNVVNKALAGSTVWSIGSIRVQIPAAVIL